MKENKQMVMNTMALPLNEDFKAVSKAVGQLLSEGWQWRGIIQDDKGMFFIELGRRFEYEPMEIGMIEATAKGDK